MGRATTPWATLFSTSTFVPLKTPEKVSLSLANYGVAVAYVGQQVLKLDLKRTDGEFWQVLDFDFVAGRPYNPAEVRDAARLAVITETTARRYFGAVAGAVGQPFELDAVRYRVVGVVRDVPVARANSYAEVWTPVTTGSDNLRKPDLLGRYQAIVLARRAADVPAIQAEVQQVVAHTPLPDPKQFKRLNMRAQPLLASHTGRFDNNTGPDGGGRALRAGGAGAGAALYAAAGPQPD